MRVSEGVTDEDGEGVMEVGVPVVTAVPLLLPLSDADTDSVGVPLGDSVAMPVPEADFKGVFVTAEDFEGDAVSLNDVVAL